MKVFDKENAELSIGKINKLHTISFFVQALVFMVIYFIGYRKTDFIISHQLTIIYVQYIMIFLTMAVIPGSEYWLKNKTQQILLVKEKAEKINRYLTALFIKLAVIELTATLSYLFLYLTGSRAFIYISVLLTLFFLLSKPGKQKIYRDLKLDHIENETP